MSCRCRSGKRRTSTRRGLKGAWSGRISLKGVRIDTHGSVTQDGEQGPSGTKIGRIRPSAKSPLAVPRLPLGKVQEVVHGRVQAMGDPDRAGSGWLLTAGYTLASLSRASAAWRARTAPVQVEAKRSPHDRV